MIFVTVGTEKFPFDRLLKTIDEALQNKEIEQEIFVQIGSSDYKPKSFTYKDYIDFDEMVKFIQKSEVVVSHAGIGSTLLCLSLGKIPILFARNVDFGEHLDNHQIDFTRKMDTLGKVIVAYNEKELIYKIKYYKKIISQLRRFHADKSKNQLINYLMKICMQIVKKR